MKTVPLELLNELADCFPRMPAGKPGRASSTTFDLDRWIQDHGIDVQGPLPWDKGRKWVFDKCPWNADHTDKSAYIVQFANGSIAAGCLHKSCGANNWAALRALLEPERRPQHRTDAANDVGESAWELPISFHQFDLPPFPTDAFPEWLKKFVSAIAVATQTPVDLASMLVLSVIAAACAKKVEVCVKEDYFEPVNIFTVTALRSGSRKSGVFKAVTKPLEDYERSEGRRTARENAMRRSRLKIKEAAHQKLQDKAAGATGKEQLALIKEAEVVAAELADACPLLATRLIADDCTPETLATLLCNNGGRIAVMSAEGGDVFELLAGRYSAKRAPNLGFYLKSHAGDQLHIDRRDREEFVHKPALTLGLAVQPTVIRSLADVRGFRERGLLGRALYSMPECPLGRRDTNPPPVPVEVRDTYHTNVLVLLNLALRQDEDGNASPHMLRLDPEARLIMQRFEEWIEPQLSEFGDLGGMSDWSGKLYGATGRIAGILHMADMVTSAAPWDTPISASTVRCAIQIAKYLIPHAKAAYNEMGADEVVMRAKAILRWIENEKCKSFTRRDLHQAMRTTFKRVADVDRPLGVLLDQRFIRERPEAQSCPGRPASPVYDVNPLWAPQNAQNPRKPSFDNFEDCEDSEMHRPDRRRHATPEEPSEPT